MDHQDIPAPAVLDGCTGVPEPLLLGLYLLQKGEVVEPGEFCKSLLQNCLIWPCLRKSLHIAKIPGGKALPLRGLRG